ncbi:UNVERIFIED_CONTAM: hypothetical protein K2H54_042177 [Gekko kuhli]
MEVRGDIHLSHTTGKTKQRAPGGGYPESSGAERTAPRWPSPPKCPRGGDWSRRKRMGQCSPGPDGEGAPLSMAREATGFPPTHACRVGCFGEPAFGFSVWLPHSVKRRFSRVEWTYEKGEAPGTRTCGNHNRASGS